MPMHQPTLFGTPPAEAAFNVYHDESGFYRPGSGSRWLLHGVLFVPASQQTQIVTLLQQIRQENAYFDEIHFVNLRRSVYGPKPQCARQWLQTFVSEIASRCYYYCLAVDTQSSGFQAERFPEPYHVYNYFARTAIIAGIAWSLSNYERVALRLHSDKKARAAGDNFATYLPRQVSQEIASRRAKRPAAYPQTRMLAPNVVPIGSNPAWAADEQKEACELIQLVDLVTSGFRQALTADSGQRAKVVLAELIARWVEDTRRPPWLQTEELHRRFSVSCFPNRHGDFHDPALAIQQINQLSLFDQ